jgi:hypothetical protein
MVLGGKLKLTIQEIYTQNNKIYYLITKSMLNFNKHEDLFLRIYFTCLHFYQVHMSEIVGTSLLFLNSLLITIFNPDILKELSSVVGLLASLLLFIGGIWYVRKQILDAKKAKIDLQRSNIENEIKDKELRMKEIDLISKELDNEIKKKDLELFHLSRQKMEMEEDHAISLLQLEIKEIKDKLKE